MIFVEIIVSGGSINSAQLLLLSGIGPKVCPASQRNWSEGVLPTYNNGCPLSTP